jgi:hydrogenase maturation protein HypF
MTLVGRRIGHRFTPEDPRSPDGHRFAPRDHRSPDDLIGRRFEIRGTVQGVGFRPWVFRLAADDHVTGRVRNDAAGVTIEAFGSAAALGEFAAHLATSPPPASDVRELRSSPIPPERLESFTITPSRPTDELQVSIPPDLATCPECLADIGDTDNRRHGYAFTNCTQCGPRFTISLDSPYDRPNTTMAGFTMCEACRREYEDPRNRRFHAQPNACPACGPTLTLADATGHPFVSDDPIGLAAGALASGAIVAVKGLGGFHLACDATSQAAVARLRERKRREAKPFAVMAADLPAAETLALLSDDDRAALQSAARPVVLAPARPGHPLAAAVAPDAPLVGVMLPYTPLHYLLMARLGTPLVMTSANLADEPLAYRNEEALTRLAGIADLFLMHDRDIATPCDDSVTRVIEARPVVLRRSRGYVPRPVLVSPSFGSPVLACGALLKNAVCIGAGNAAHMGPHVGDLASVAAFEAFASSIDRLQRFLKLAPEIVAHDLHPEYQSTQWALEHGGRAIGVQHHHAHIASVMAEHGVRGPVIGAAYDGAGYGTDGASWGGEIMVAGLDSFERIATLRPIALAGGDQAIREPWRIALALVDDAFDGELALDSLPLFEAIPADRLHAVQRLLRTRGASPPAHGAGRYFDGIGALVLNRTRSDYEGQVALAWNGVAEDEEPGGYPFDLDTSATPWLVDLRPMVRAVVADMRNGVAPAVISARFHAGLADATVAVVERIARTCGSLPVALSGGCFQNPRLAHDVVSRLSGRQVFLNRLVPPGDGGIALGQAMVAGAVARRM